MSRKRRPKKPKAPIWSPQMWPTWLLVGGAWVIARLPMSWVLALGRGLGSLLFRVGKSRREITLINLQRCFPGLDEAAIHALAKQTFKESGMGAVELMVPWLNPKRDLSDCFEIRGREHLDAAVAQGRGVVLIGAHYAVMDFIAPALARCGPIDVMYRYNKNPVWERLQVNGRRLYFDGVIERQDTRAVLKNLKSGRVIWYAADQDYGAKHSVFAPFFGIEAATIVATARFARLNDSPVLLLRQSRDAAAQKWTLEFFPAIEDYPSGDDETDAARMNALLEAQIRRAPEQYLWMHKRFKTRPAGAPDFYRPEI